MKKALFTSITGLIIYSFLQNYSFAFTLSSPPVAIPGGNVKPKSVFNLLISPLQLKGGIYYNLSCNIINPNYSDKYPSAIKITSYFSPHSSAGRITINDKALIHNQWILNMYNNKLVVSDVMITANPYGGKPVIQFEFQNLDETSTIVVNDCFASYAG
tara:strand:- start:1520 stop:1993 length:474 start_codon:yes stop_codon:yes gene_type:complete